MKNNLTKNKGFTLIEMAVVIAVIALLMPLAFRAISTIQAKARDTRRIGDLRNAQNYLELYFNKCGYYPGGADAAGACNIVDPTTWDNLKQTMKDAKIIDRFPQEPISGRTYCYGVESAERLEYVLGAKLEGDNQILKENADLTGVNFRFTGGCPAVGEERVYWIKS